MKYYRILTKCKARSYAYFARSTQSAKALYKSLVKHDEQIQEIVEITEEAFMKMLTKGGEVKHETKNIA